MLAAKSYGNRLIVGMWYACMTVSGDSCRGMFGRSAAGITYVQLTLPLQTSHHMLVTDWQLEQQSASQ